MVDLPQADRWLSTEALRLIGGVRTYGQRLTFYLGVMNTATLMFMLYRESTVIQSLFPNVLAWLAFIGFVAVPAIMAFDFGLMHPSQITYNSGQQAQTKRNPHYELTTEISQQLDRLEQQLAARVDGGTPVNIVCRDCRSLGRFTTYKDESAVECPDCNELLYRSINA